MQDYMMVQTAKSLLAMQETQVQSLSWEDPLVKGRATHTSILAWRSSWTEEPGGLQSVGMQRVRHDWATSTFTSCHTYLYICMYMTHVFMRTCHNICLYAYTHTTWEEHKVSLWFWYSKPLHYTSSCNSLGDRHIYPFVLWCYFRSSHTHFHIKQSSHDLIWCWHQPWEAGRSCVLLAVKWLIPGESTPWSRAQTRSSQPFTVAPEYRSAVPLPDSR